MNKKNPQIIFEVANSHNGNFELLKKTINDYSKIKYKKKAIKFQIFKAEELATSNAAKANYQLKTTEISETQKEMLKSLELPLETYFELKVSRKKH